MKRKRTNTIPTETSLAVVKLNTIVLPENKSSIEQIKDYINYDNIVTEYNTYQSENPMTRMRKYAPDMAVQVACSMYTGKGLQEVGRCCSISSSTIAKYADKLPTFAVAIKRAHELYMAYWLELGTLNIGTKGFNSSMYIYQVSNRFKTHGWTRQDVKDTGGNTTINVDARKQSVNLIEARKTYKNLSSMELKALTKIAESQTMED